MKKCPYFDSSIAIEDIPIDCDGKCDELCIINMKAENYLNQYAFRTKGWYEEFQKTELWKEAKKLLKQLKNPIECEYCGVDFYESYMVLHHNIYDWGSFFHLENISFLHYNCHEQWHKDNPIPNWRNLPDKLYDMFIFPLKYPDQEILGCCWKCGNDFKGWPYQFLCKKCYWDLKIRGIKPNWRDYL